MLAPDALSEIRSKLERYQIAYCGLMHERVLELSKNETGNFVKRYGLCDRLTRRYRLGCAHTRANHEFCQIILSIGALFPAARTLAGEFEQLFLNVYVIDIAKGELEKQLALALLVNNRQLIAAAKDAIAEVVLTHHQLIKTIEELRARLMAILSS